MIIKTLGHRIEKANINIGSPVATERIRGWKLTKIRKRIAIKYNYSCVDCGRVTVDGEVDHEIPLFMGGSESDENRRWRCKECHAKKSAEEERGRGIGI